MITPLFHQRSHSMPVGRTFIKLVNMLPLDFGKNLLIPLRVHVVETQY